MRIWNWSSWTRNAVGLVFFFSKCRLWGGKKVNCDRRLQWHHLLDPTSGSMHLLKSSACPEQKRCWATRPSACPWNPTPWKSTSSSRTCPRGSPLGLQLLRRRRDRTTIWLCIWVIAVPVPGEDCWGKRQTNRSPRPAEGRGLKITI